MRVVAILAKRGDSEMWKDEVQEKDVKRGEADCLFPTHVWHCLPTNDVYVSIVI